MKMLCIGGACDGQWVEADENQMVIMVAEEAGPPEITGLVETPVEIKAHPYVTAFHFRGREKIWFLQPPQQTDKETFSLLINGYRKARS